MKLIKQSIQTHWTPLILAILCFLAHGLFIPWLGFFADDWTYLWTTHILGVEGALRYFFLGNNRPVFGLLHYAIINILGYQPWVWHLFGIFWLWMTSVLLWWLIRLVWPNHSKPAFYAAALFAIYPGFQLQLISLTIGHMWLIHAGLLFSFCMNVLAIRRPERFLLYSSLAILASAINLLSFEYFIMLELVRPFLLFLVIRRSVPNLYHQVRQTLYAWVPYALLFAGIIIWRTFFFVLQTEKYQLSLTDQIRIEPAATLLHLGRTIFRDVFWDASVLPWINALKLPLQTNWINKSNFLYIGLSLSALALVYLYLSRMRANQKEQPDDQKFYSVQMIAVGLMALFAAGWPFWLTGLEVEPVYWNSRFTMPFVFGTVLFLSGILTLIPVQKLQWAFLALMVGFATGSQHRVANDFRRDWQLQSAFIQQLIWRIPAVPPGTTIYSNELPFKYFSDNTISAELNWIVSRGKPGYHANIYLAYPEEMMRYMVPSGAEPGSFRRDMMSIDFYGSMDNVIGIHYQNDACLRLLDSRFDPGNVRNLDINRQIAGITKPELISFDEPPYQLDRTIFGPEGKDDWCYTVQMADIARQKGEWAQVASLGDQLDHESKALYRDPMVAVIFIEGYARNNQLEKALEISSRTQTQSYFFKHVLCPVWDQIEHDLGETPEKNSFIIRAREQHQCK